MTAKRKPKQKVGSKKLKVDGRHTVKATDGRRGKTHLRRNPKKRLSLMEEYPASVEVFNLTKEKALAMTMIVAGDSQAAVAEKIGVGERTIRRWCQEFWEQVLARNPQVWMIWGRIVGKCLAVVEKTLDGKNREEGADIRTALTILKTSPLLGGSPPAVLIDNSKNLSITDNRQQTDIVVNPKDDNDFADGAISEFERMARLLKVQQVSQGSST